MRRADHFRRCVQIHDPLNLCTHYTHVVAHVVLGHPYEPANIALWGAPVDRPRDACMPPPHRSCQPLFLNMVDQQREEGNRMHVALDQVCSLCLLRLPRVITELRSWLARKLWHPATNVDLWDCRILELLWEHKIALQFLVGLLQQIRQFNAKGSNIVESVQIKNDEEGDCLHTL
jgi:hypothetical protein